MANKNADTQENTTPSKRHTLAVSVNSETFALFEEVAWQRKHRRNSDALREAVSDWIAKHGSVNSGATTGVKQ